MKRIPAKAFTWMACIAILAAFAANVGALTSGFAYWTYDDRRVALANAAGVRASPVVLATADGAVRLFWPGMGRDRVYLVDFIYTRCPSICQVLGSEYQRMQNALRMQGGPNVTLLSVSFDARDTKEDLREYATRFRALPDYWTIAVPRNAADTARLLRELGVVVVPDGMGGYVHNAAIHLINGEGELIAIFPYEEWEAALSAAGRYAGGAAKGDL